MDLNISCRIDVLVLLDKRSYWNEISFLVNVILTEIRNWHNVILVWCRRLSYLPYCSATSDSIVYISSNSMVEAIRKREFGLTKPSLTKKKAVMV